MNVEYRLEPFGKNVPAPAKDLAMLHAELLPTSPLAKLGPQFLERFYYTDLPREGYIFGAVAYVNDCPAGFVVATYDSNGFMKAALRHLWGRLVWEIGTTILFHPLIIRSIWEALSIMRSRKTEESDRPEGEILSMGVLPAYLDPRFVRKTGLRLSNDLFQEVMTQLQHAKKLVLIRAIVDADNFPAQMFYQGVDWKMERGHVPGWKIPSVEFVWRPSIEKKK